MHAPRGGEMQLLHSSGLQSHAGPENGFFQSLSAELPGGCPSTPAPQLFRIIPSFGFEFSLGLACPKSLSTSALQTHSTRKQSCEGN